MSNADRHTIQALYDANRFLDAYAATRDRWDRAAAVGRSAAELILAGRLAHRLGSSAVCLWCIRHARRLAPHDPDVRYFSRFSDLRGLRLLDCLATIERDPPPTDLPPAVRASWLAWDAVYVAVGRDFDHARTLVDEAVALGEERAWVHACRAQVLLADDDWDGALAAAEEAWRLSPGMPAAADALASTYARRGRSAEAAACLIAAADQSYEVTLTALECCCSAAEHSEAGAADAWAARAAELVARLPALAPLASRAVRNTFAFARLDVALLRGDYAAAAAAAAALPPGPWRERFRDLSPRTTARPTVLPHRPLRQKHDTCLPTSIAAVLGGFGVDLDSDALATALTYGGTPLCQAAAWLEAQGFTVRHALASPDLCRQLIARGIPFVFAYSGDSDAHATAAIGLDDTAGVLLVHDPASPRRARFCLDTITDAEAPLGPDVMVVLPAAEAHRLDGLAPETFHLPGLAQAFWRAWPQGGLPAVEPVLARLREADPDHPLSRHLEAWYLTASGQVGRAVQVVTALATAWPECTTVRRSLVGCLRETGNTAQLRAALRDIVEHARLPGLEFRQPWRYPPPTYVAQYADLLALSADRCTEAQDRLTQALRQAPLHPELYHVLGDLHSRCHAWTESLLPFRLASSLAPDQDHYAWSLAYALRLAGREAEALAGLRRRAERLSHYDRGAAAWCTLVNAHEAFGHPEAATATLAEALGRAPDNESLLAFAADFWRRLGRCDEARAAVDRLRDRGFDLLYLEAACALHEGRGEWEPALDLCRQWLERQPASLPAKAAWVRLAARQHGRQRTVDQLLAWLQTWPGHEGLEDLLMEAWKSVLQPQPAADLVRRRLERNPDDAWAWREQGHLLMDSLEAAPPDERPQLEQALAAAVAGCQRTCPDHEATLFLLARHAELQGNVRQAIDTYLHAIRLNPALAYGYHRVCDLFARVTAAEQETLTHELEQAMLGTIGHLHGARDLALVLASHHGLPEAEAVVRHWEDLRHDDPQLIVAHADLLLEYGRGREDNARAEALLRHGVDRFPAHLDLQVSLARACANLLRDDDEIAVCRAILCHSPAHNGARRRLASLLARKGSDDEARTLLVEATRREPLDSAAWQDLALFDRDRQRPRDAVQTLQTALRQMPEHVGLRRLLMELLLGMGDCEQAEQTAREGTRHLPQVAAAWLVLGLALARSPRHSQPRETESAFRCALDLDARLFEAADELTVLLAAQHQYDAARQLLQQQANTQTDPSPAHGRLAWVARAQGARDDAYNRLRDTLRDAPRYAWGWAQLMEWLQEDKDWPRARELLATWPAELLDLANLRAQRLSLLEQAGQEPTSLDQPWADLLRDFPHDLSIHLRRYDTLVKNRRHEEAEAVLTAVERLHPTVPVLLARKVQVLTRRSDWDAALATALRLWTHPADNDSWANASAWQTIEETGRGVEAIAALTRALAEGRRPNTAAFHRATRFLATRLREAGRRRGRPHLVTLREWLDLLDHVPWDAAHHRACVLGALGETPRFQEALRYWQRHRARLDPETPVWQEIGHLLADHDTARAAAFLADWRARPGVRMYIVANYVLALRRLGIARVQQVLESSRDALARLPHDHTARYLVCTLCEAALRLDRVPDFLAHARQYHDYLELPPQDTPEHYLQRGCEYAPPVLLAFESVLRATPEERAAGVLAAAAAQVARHVTSAQPAWIPGAWHRHLRRLPDVPPAARRQALWWRLRRSLTLSGLAGPQG